VKCGTYYEGDKIVFTSENKIGFIFGQENNSWGGIASFCSMGSRSKVLLAIIYLFLLGLSSSVLGLDDIGIIGTRIFDEWPPAHINHTFPGVSVSSDEISLEVLAVGDVVGQREIILWMKVENRQDDYFLVTPSRIRVWVDTGPRRDCYYHNWSESSHTSSCDDYENVKWRHQDYNLSPYESIGFWVVYSLPHYQFLDITDIVLEYPKVNIPVSIKISRDRVVEDILYLNIREPRQGLTYTKLRSVLFFVYDRDVDPIEIEYWIEVDGNTILNGHLTQRVTSTTICPPHLNTLTRFGEFDLDLGGGPHRLVVRISDGHHTTEEDVNFTIKPRVPQVTVLPVKWVVNTSSFFKDLKFGANHQGAPTVWDVDGDGEKEMIYGTSKGPSKRLWCIGLDTRLEWVYPSLDLPGLPGDPTSKVSLVDVNNDGIYEIALAGRGGRLHLINGLDGNMVWYWNEPHQQDMLGAPQAMDVNGDGFIEFFLNTMDGYIHRVSHEGRLIWTSFQTQSNMAHPTICDIDQDGLYDVVWASDDHVYCIDALRGSEKWRYSPEPGSNVKTANIIVADIDKDGEYEAVTWTSDRTTSVISLNSTGGLEWAWRHPRQGPWPRIWSCQAMGDLDKDGSMDIVIMSSDAAFAIRIGGEKPETMWEINFTSLSHEGYLPWGATNYYRSYYHTIADIDGDNELEILWLAPFPIVTDGATGRLEAYYLDDYLRINTLARNGGWWGDINGDNTSEWIVELWTNSSSITLIYALTLNGEFPAESPWPEYYHTAYPSSFQYKQDWLTLKSAGSNSLWFPIPEHIIPLLLLICTSWLTFSKRSLSTGSKLGPGSRSVVVYGLGSDKDLGPQGPAWQNTQPFSGLFLGLFIVFRLRHFSSWVLIFRFGW